MRVNLNPPVLLRHTSAEFGLGRQSRPFSHEYGQAEDDENIPDGDGDELLGLSTAATSPAAEETQGALAAGDHCTCHCSRSLSTFDVV